MRRIGVRAVVLGLLAIAPVAAPGASAAVPHEVMPGETLWSIAAANNLTTRTVAVYNGVSEDTQVIAGQTIEVPTVAEGAGALAAAPAESSAPEAGSGVSHTVARGESLSSVAAANGVTVDELATANGLAPDAYLIEGEAIQVPAATSLAPGMADIPSPWGPLQLRADAAEAWNAMRAEALRLYGIELEPGGPLSAYRTSDQQAELYDLYLSGQGAPAVPPGSSSHEAGLSVDLATPEMRSIVDEIGGQFGWGKVNGPGEWWHVDYVAG
jgi:LysM repeat protein